MIDSVYEAAGYSLAELTRSALSSVGLPLVLALAGLAWLVHELASDRAQARQLLVHLMSLILVWWAMSPTRIGDVPAPRFAVWTGEAVDLLQKRAIGGIQARFLDRPFAWERLAALSSFAKIYDPALRKDVGDFLEACAKPALARAEPSSANLLADGALPYDAECARRRAELRARIGIHLERDPAHRVAMETASEHDPGGAAAFRARYEEEVCRRAVDDPGSPTSEPALVAAALGSTSYLDPGQSTGAYPAWMKGWPFALPGISGLWDQAADAGLTWAAELQQNWSNRWTSKQRYFLVTTLAPHVYGLSLLFLLGLFPLAGIWALWPGKWTALANWTKVFVSIKLWPVCWAALTQFNAKRSAMEAFDPGPRGSGDVFIAVSSMYLLTPGLCFLVVHLGARAAATPFAPAVPSPAGPGLGPAGAVVRALGK